MEFSWQSLAFYFGFILLVKGENLAQRCSLFISEIPDCITCNVIYNTSSEDFNHHFLNESFQDEDSQVQINASFKEIVLISGSDAKYVVVSLIPELNGIHSVTDILFKLLFFSSEKQQYVTSFHAAKIALTGYDRDYLDKIKMMLPLEDVDLSKNVEMWSHSYKPKKGAHNKSITIQSSSPLPLLKLRGVESDSIRGICKHLKITRNDTLQGPSDAPKDEYKIESSSALNSNSISKQLVEPRSWSNRPSLTILLSGALSAVLCGCLIDLVRRKLMHDAWMKQIITKLLWCCLHEAPNDNVLPVVVSVQNGHDEMELNEIGSNSHRSNNEEVYEEAQFQRPVSEQPMNEQSQGVIDGSILPQANRNAARPNPALSFRVVSYVTSNFDDVMEASNAVQRRNERVVLHEGENLY